MSTQTTPEPTTMSLPDMLAQAALQTAITDALKKSKDAHRAATFLKMLEARDALGVKSFDVRVDGQVLAGATITEPSDRHVLSGSGELKEAYLAYMEEHYPEQIETVIQVRPAFEKLFLEKLEACGEDNRELCDTKTGIVVPGAVNVPATDPTTWSMRFKKGDESKAAVLRASLPEEALALLGITPTMGELPEYPEDTPAEPVVVVAQVVENNDPEVPANDDEAEALVAQDEAEVVEVKPKARKRAPRKKAEPAPSETAA